MRKIAIIGILIPVIAQAAPSSQMKAQYKDAVNEVCMEIINQNLENEDLNKDELKKAKKMFTTYCDKVAECVVRAAPNDFALMDPNWIGDKFQTCSYTNRSVIDEEAKKFTK